MARRKSYTNEDQIRNMNSDQLAKALLDANDSGVSIPFCQELPECERLLDDGIIPEEKCLQCVKDWLKRPAFMGGGELMPNMKSEEYWRGKPGALYGIWNDVKKEFQFGICEDTPALAEARLKQKIGRDSHKWRFTVRRLPVDPLHRAKVLAHEE